MLKGKRISSPDTSCAMNAAGHDGFYERSNIFVFNSPWK